MYSVEYFPEPEAFTFSASLVKIPGLDGTGKMGKSEGNAINLADDEKTIRKKVMGAVTDSGPTRRHSKPPEPIANLFTLMEVVSEPEVVAHFKHLYSECQIRYGDMKKQLAEDVLKVTLPIRERILEISSDSDYLRKVVRMGAEKARLSAGKTLNEVREIIGFRSF